MASYKRWLSRKSAHKGKSQIESHTFNQSAKTSVWVNMKHFSLKKQLLAMKVNERVKAFITDMFMINMPLLYLTTYVFLDGKEAFTHNQTVIFVCTLGYGIITSLFFAFSSQTPGYRYMRIKLIKFCDKNVDSHVSPDILESTTSQESSIHAQQNAQNKLHKVGFVRAFVRYIVWIFGTCFLFGVIVGFFRADGRCLHDVLCGTDVLIYDDNANKA